VGGRGGRKIDLDEYYPKRLVRLGVPIWGSLVLAVALKLLVSHHRLEGGSWWLNEHSRPLRLGALFHEMTLVFGAGGFATNSALWSLTWEVLFSLLLPFFMTAMLLARGRPVLLIVGLSALSASAEVSLEVPDAIRYFPMFAIGIVLAIELPRLQAARERLAGAPSAPMFWALGGLSALALTARWSLSPITQALPAPAVKLAAAGTSFLALLGATGIVTLTLCWDGFRRQMERPTWQAAGKHSYSLYLVHEPIVVSTAFAFGVTTSVLPVLLVGVPLGLLASYGFYRWVEAPSIGLATRVGKAAARRARPAGRAAEPAPDGAPVRPSAPRQAA
jgi:peptidoglycan/LPS O-acetylase OafA/YrhL